MKKCKYCQKFFLERHIVVLPNGIEICGLCFLDDLVDQNMKMIITKDETQKEHGITMNFIIPD